MTTSDVLEQVCALTYGDAAAKREMAGGFLIRLNLRLGEEFDLNNALRQRAGKGALAAAPTLADGEEIPYEPALTRLLAYALAGDLFAEEDETGMSNVYRERYEQGRQAIAPVFWGQVGA